MIWIFLLYFSIQIIPVVIIVYFIMKRQKEKQEEKDILSRDDI